MVTSCHTIIRIVVLHSQTRYHAFIVCRRFKLDICPSLSACQHVVYKLHAAMQLMTLLMVATIVLPSPDSSNHAHASVTKFATVYTFLQHACRYIYKGRYACILIALALYMNAEIACTRYTSTLPPKLAAGLHVSPFVARWIVPQTHCSVQA